MIGRLPACIPAVLVVLSAAAQAHHGWSEYDASKRLELSGVIRASGYEHPHAHLTLETSGQTWSVVLAPPSRMSARGIAPSTLEPGARVEVVGYPSRNKNQEMRAERISVGGKTVELR